MNEKEGVIWVGRRKVDVVVLIFVVKDRDGGVLKLFL